MILCLILHRYLLIPSRLEKCMGRQVFLFAKQYQTEQSVL